MVVFEFEHFSVYYTCSFVPGFKFSKEIWFRRLFKQNQDELHLLFNSLQENYLLQMKIRFIYK